jgi:signal transduction histidine kinase/CheY-like chemotaxis protein
MAKIVHARIQARMNPPPGSTPSGAGARSERNVLVRRLFILTAAPALAITMLLVSWLTQRHLDEIERLLEVNAHTLASQTALLAVSPIAGDDRAELHRIATSLRDVPQVRRLRIMRLDGEVLESFGVHADDRPQNYVLASATVYDPHTDERQPPQVLGVVEIGVSREPLQASRRGHLLALAVALLASLVLFSLTGAWVARSIGTPIKLLARAVRHLGQGRLDQRIAVTERGEIGVLQQGFNTTAQALENALQSMQDRIEAATAALAQKNCELEAAHVTKSRFFAAASHDLRQPLHALTLLTASLRSDSTPTRQAERIGLIEDSVKSLDRLFTELIDLSRLESGSVAAVPCDFALDELLIEISKDFRAVAESKGLRLVARPTREWVRADRTMLGRILKNLVSNAIRYTAQGGLVVAARRRGERIWIDVWDTGSGIAPQHQGRVFEEFFRVDPADGLRSEALGLGLSTVYRLCQVMRTPVILRSRPGRGSMFRVDVPRARPVPKAPPAPPPAASPKSLRGCCVLVIDDERPILEGIGWLLESWGCHVATAESLHKGWEALHTLPHPPDLVISDLSLRGGENGLEVLDTLRRHLGAAGGPGPACLLITGETAAHRLREIERAGVRVLFKPVLPETLRQLMGELLDSRAQRT